MWKPIILSSTMLSLIVALLLSNQASSSNAGAISSSSSPGEFDAQFDDNYNAHFNVDPAAKTVTIRATVKTPGWVGFGISPQGVMNGADIFISGVKDGTPYSGDFHGVDHMPIEDGVQNWKLKSARESGGTTEVEFSRPFNTGDGQQDVEIGEGEITVIWAYGRDDDTKQRHVQRGSTKVAIRQAGQQEGQDSAIQIDARDTSSVANNNTSKTTKPTTPKPKDAPAAGSASLLIIPNIIYMILMCLGKFII